MYSAARPVPFRLAVSVLLGGSLAAAQGLSVSLSPSTASPLPVGSVVTFTAASGSQSGNLWYRFRVRDRAAEAVGCPPLRNSSPAVCGSRGFAVVRDFGPVANIPWTASDHEGIYDIEVTARDNSTGATATAISEFEFTSLATAGAVVSPTVNPLVLFYSAPPCAIGSSMHVEFQAPDGTVQSTNSKPCTGRSMNFYIAGVETSSFYSLHDVQDGSDAAAGSVLTASVPSATFTFAARTLVVPPPSAAVDTVVLQSRFGNPAATDMQGNLLWYSIQDVSMIARPEPGGRFLGWYEDATKDTAHQTLREFDLAGNLLRETNAARVNEQLAAMGMHSINAFHHEARPLPSGGILTMGATERILTDVQGPGDVDVLGDIILVLDSNLQVVWAWDTFDHLDPHRMATLNETCAAQNGGCPPIHLASVANDWTHGNALQLTSDGNILYSTRHQDWLVKIDYANGLGSGDILWRLGKDGDFQFVSSDSYPWFSHQHDANFDANGMLDVFDNGNVRNAADPSAHSRGQVIQLDEVHRTATLVVNADLGDFSTALGSAQTLPDGTWHFHLGYITASGSARIVQVDSSGRLIYDLHVGEIEYRSFRMRDLYTP